MPEAELQIEFSHFLVNLFATGKWTLDILEQVFKDSKCFYYNRYTLTLPEHLNKLYSVFEENVILEEENSVFSRNKPQQIINEKQYTSQFWRFHIEAFYHFGGFDQLLEVFKTGTLKEIVQACNVVKSLLFPTMPEFKVQIQGQVLKELQRLTTQSFSEKELKEVGQKEVDQFMENFDGLVENYKVNIENIVKKQEEEQKDNEPIALPEFEIAGIKMGGKKPDQDTEMMEPGQENAEMQQMEVEEERPSCHEITDKTYMELAFQCITLKSLQKNLMGLNLLQTIIKQSQSKPAMWQTKRWVTKEYLAEWFQHKNIFKVLFDESAHQEVIKKSNQVIEFLCELGLVGPNEITAMWNTMLKHETYVQVICNLLQSIVQKGSLDSTIFIFEKLKEVPFSDLDKFHLQLLRKICFSLCNKQMSLRNRPVEPIRTGRNMKKKNSDQGKKGVNFFGETGGTSKDNWNKPLEQRWSDDDEKWQNKAWNQDADHELKVEDDVSKKKRDKIRNRSGTPKKKGNNTDLFATEFVPENAKKVSNKASSKKTGEGPKSRENDVSPWAAEEEKAPEEKKEEAKKSEPEQEPEEDEEEEKEGNFEDNFESLEIGLKDEQKKRIVKLILELFWQLCQDSAVISSNLSHQSQKLAIETIGQIITICVPKCKMFFIRKCILQIQMNESVIPTQKILQHLLRSFNDKPGKLAKSIKSLEKKHSIISECLGAYLEFKRVSLNYVLNQVGNNEQEQENLETQSSLEGDDGSSQKQQFSNADTNEENDQPKSFLTPKGKGQEEELPKEVVNSLANSAQQNQIQNQRRTQEREGSFSMTDITSDQELNQELKQEARLTNALGAVTKKAQQPLLMQVNEAPEGSSNPSRVILNTEIVNQVHKLTFKQEMDERLKFIQYLFQAGEDVLEQMHITIMWEFLVVYAFYEPERDQFFDMMTDLLKVQLKKDENMFEDDPLDTFYYDTMLKLDFRFLSEAMYNCFEKFFMTQNEKYGLIIQHSAYDLEVFDTQLIGIKALWEIVLQAQNQKVAKKAASCLQRIYSKLSQELLEDVFEVKQEVLAICFTNIKAGLKKHKQTNATISEKEDASNRISRAVSQLRKFIDEFEGTGSGHKYNDPEVTFLVSVKISGSKSQDFEMKQPITVKVSSLRDQIAQKLDPPVPAAELILTAKKGKTPLTQIERTLKQYELTQNGFDIEISRDDFADDTAVFNLQKEQQIQEAINNLSVMLGETIEREVIELACRKCTSDPNQAAMMLFDEGTVQDLREEVQRKKEEDAGGPQPMEEEIKEPEKEEEQQIEETKLNQIISNKAEYFDLLFDLLNMNIPEISNETWSLLIQIPVNKQLYSQISELRINDESDWHNIIDTSCVFKMLYSLQIVNQLLSKEQTEENWPIQFLLKGGFKHLFNIMLGPAIEQFLTPKGKKGVKKQQKESETSEQTNNTIPKCIGMLVSIVKVYLEATLVGKDDPKIHSLILNSVTTPYKFQNQVDAKDLAAKLEADLEAGVQTEIGAEAKEIMESSMDNNVQGTPHFHSPRNTPPTGTPADFNFPPMNPIDIEPNLNGQVKDPQAAQQEKKEEPVKLKSQAYTKMDNFHLFAQQIQGDHTDKILSSFDIKVLVDRMLGLVYQAASFSSGSEEISILVQTCLDLILPCVLWKPQELLVTIFDFEHLETLITKTLLQGVSTPQIRKALDQTLRELSAYSKKEETLSSTYHLIQLLLKNLPSKSDKSNTCKEFFDLLTFLIKKNKDSFVVAQNELQEGQFQADVLLDRCFEEIQERETLEKRTEDEEFIDHILAGYLHLASSLIESKPELKENSGENLEKIYNLLFDLPSDKNPENPKFKRSLTRKNAFDLLLALSDHNRDNFSTLLKKLANFRYAVSFKEDEEFDITIGHRGSAGYVGLRNYGCTCYMNSLMQQLFMIKEFRNGILQSSIQNKEAKKESVLYQLQTIFSNLQESQQKFYAPEGFLKAFKFGDEPINVRIQQDTHEFFNLLCGQLETALKDTNDKLLEETIVGSLCNELKSLEPDKEFVRENKEPLFSLSVDIKNKKTLQDALDMFIRPDILEGNNMYHCDKYDCKIRAQKRSFIDRLPSSLIVSLKRFEYDYQNMRRIKVNDYCEFPWEIDFKPWTKEGVQERDQKLKEESQNQEGNKQKDHTKDVKEVVDDNIDDEEVEVEEVEMQEHQSQGGYSDIIDESASKVKGSGQKKMKKEGEEEEKKEIKSAIRGKKRNEETMYELTGILLHSGGADSGHYYSIIKERKSGKWLKFDDRNVTWFDEKDIPNECFGENPENKGAYGCHRNAYLLVYTKIAKKDPEPQQTPLCEEIKASNLLFLKLKLFLNKEYFDFASSFLGMGTQFEAKNSLQFTEEEAIKAFDQEFKEQEIDEKALEDVPQIESCKLGLIHALDLLLRLRDKEAFAKWANHLAREFTMCPKACLWALRLFQEKQLKDKLCTDMLFKEIEKVRFSFSVLLKTILEESAMKESEDLIDSATGKVLKTLFNKEVLETKNIISLEFYFKMLLDFAQTGQKETNLLLKLGGLRILTDFLDANTKSSASAASQTQTGAAPAVYAPANPQAYGTSSLTQREKVQAILPLLSHLVRSCSTSQLTGAQAFSPTALNKDISIEHSIQLSEEEVSLLSRAPVFNHGLLQNFAEMEGHLAQLLIHLIWRYDSLMEYILQQIRDVLKDSMEKKVWGYDISAAQRDRKRLFDLLQEIFKGIGDQQQAAISAFFKCGHQEDFLAYLTTNKADWKNKKHVIYLLAKMVQENENVKTYIDNHKAVVESELPTFILNCKSMNNSETEKAELEFVILVFSELFAFIEPREDPGEQVQDAADPNAGFYEPQGAQNNDVEMQEMSKPQDEELDQQPGTGAADPEHQA